MTDISTQNPLANLAPDDKATPMMVYSPNRLTWGQIITKEGILPGRILLSATMPDYISLFNVQTLATQGTLSKPVKFTELHIPVLDIAGYHLMPPAEDAINYDPTAPNRIMMPIIAHVGAFNFNAEVRISTQTTLQRFLGNAKSEFISIYNAEVRHPGNPKMKPINVTVAYIRRTLVAVGAVG